MLEAKSQELETYKKLRPATATALAAIQLLVLTGCRRMEVLTLKWGDVDFAGRCFRFRDTKAGKQLRPIGRAALDHLKEIKPENAKAEDYIFRGDSEAGHFVGLPKSLGADRGRCQDQRCINSWPAALVRQRRGGNELFGFHHRRPTGPCQAWHYGAICQYA